MSYINLIKPSEVRYQSIATDKGFLIKVGVLLGLLFSAYAGWKGWEIIQETRTAKAVAQEWETIKPRYQEATLALQTVAKLQKTKTYLDSWSEARLPTTEILLELSSLLPASIQASQIQITGRFLGIESGGTLDKNTTIKNPERQYRILLKGLSYGAEGEREVFQLVQRIQKSEALSSWVQGVKLQDSQKIEQKASPSDAGTVATRNRMSDERLFGSSNKPDAQTANEPPPTSVIAFTIDCELKPRVLQWPGKN